MLYTWNGFYTWLQSKISFWSPPIIGSKWTFLGCSDRWLPTRSIFSYIHSQLLYIHHIFLRKKIPPNGKSHENFPFCFEICPLMSPITTLSSNFGLLHQHFMIVSSRQSLHLFLLLQGSVLIHTGGFSFVKYHNSQSELLSTLLSRLMFTTALMGGQWNI